MLHHKNSIFQAELLAILEALQWHSSHHSQNKMNIVNINTDSLHTMNSFIQRNPLVQSIQILLHALSSILTVNLTGVKAPIAIFGNEIADSLTKITANKITVSQHYFHPLI